MFLSHPLWGLGTTYDVHLGLIGKRVVDLLLVLNELFSERELTFTFAIAYVVVRPVCRLSSVVCLSSVIFVHPILTTQAIDISGNVYTPFGTLAICDLSMKFLWRSSQGNASGGGLNQRVQPNIAILDFFKARSISRKWCKIGANLVLITNRKSHMSFRWVTKSVTLNDLLTLNGVIGLTAA